MKGHRNDLGQFAAVSWRTRFWEYVDVTDTCWLWTADKVGRGYGQMRVGIQQKLAHRLAWEMYNGAIPPPLQIDHLCRVRECVNPAHMELVTRRENILRGTCPSAVNAQKTHCKRGHPFDEANTYVAANGSRHCRACKRDWWRWKTEQTRLAANLERKAAR